MEGSGFPLFPEVALKVKECRLCLQQRVEGPCRTTVWGEAPQSQPAASPTQAPMGRKREKPVCRLEAFLYELQEVRIPEWGGLGGRTA